MLERKTGFILDKSIIYNQEALDNLDLIGEEYLQHKHYPIYQYLFSEEELKAVIENFFNSVMNKDYRQYLSAFYKKIQYIPEANKSTVLGRYCFKKVKCVKVSPLENSLQASIYVHEFIHFLNFDKYPKMFNNAYYTELMPILSQHLFSLTLDNYYEHMGELNHYFNFVLYRLDGDFNNAFSLSEYLENYGEELYEYLLMYKIGNVYANALTSFCMDDPKKFLKKYRAILNGSLTIDQLISYYNISLTDYKTIETTLNLVKKVSK